MTGIAPVNNVHSSNLVFHREGQTFSTLPLLAPGRVAAFEVTNLRTFRRTAAYMGVNTQKKESTP